MRLFPCLWHPLLLVVLLLLTMIFSWFFFFFTVPRPLFRLFLLPPHLQCPFSTFSPVCIKSPRRKYIRALDFIFQTHSAKLIACTWQMPRKCLLELVYLFSSIIIWFFIISTLLFSWTIKLNLVYCIHSQWGQYCPQRDKNWCLSSCAWIKHRSPIVYK